MDSKLASKSQNPKTPINSYGVSMTFEFQSADEARVWRIQQGFQSETCG